MGSHMNWAGMAKKLSAHFDVYSYDARNHGQSPHTSTMTYEEMAGDLLAFQNEQHIEHAFILGHSMGGKTAMLHALQYPHRVEKLVVIDIGTRPYDPGVLHVLKAMKDLPIQAAESRKEVESLMTDIAPDAAVRNFFLQNLRRKEIFEWRVNLDAIIASYSRVLVPMADMLRPGLRFKDPLLALAGEKSTAVRDETDFVPWFTDVTYLKVPGAGHWPQADNPEFVYESIFDFLKKEE